MSRPDNVTAEVLDILVTNAVEFRDPVLLAWCREAADLPGIPFPADAEVGCATEEAHIALLDIAEEVAPVKRETPPEEGRARRERRIAVLDRILDVELDKLGL